MTDNLTEQLQAIDEKLDKIREYSFNCFDTLRRILLEIFSMQKQEDQDQK